MSDSGVIVDLAASQNASLALVDALARKMREHGIASARIGDVALTMAPASAPAALPVPPSIPAAAEPAPLVSAEPDSDTCPCGHSLMVEHGDSGCYHGCKDHRCFLRAEAP